ncbi:hypothetical protein [Nannocystis pusilla]|uniref:Lipoprotein n=1 Tax=Nannocystis pusilla TaxID=889268 RepID=A0ABS7U2S2_9BACT|nr:hypothetical protein [Nannocystis pusilla]MBZ5714662.1 hypothetical protein [Nannocystis pusilla]
MPEVGTWMLGVWSDEAVNIDTNDCSVTHLKIDADGKAYRGGFRCGSTAPTYDEAYVWEPDGEDAIVMRAEDDANASAWRIPLGTNMLTQRQECDLLVTVPIVDGELSDNPRVTYVRGAVCTRAYTSCPGGAGNCDAYKTVWCEEPPPPCEDETAP